MARLKEPYNRTLKHNRQHTLFVMVFHSDDVPPCGSGTGQNGGGIQGLDGEWVDHSDVLS